MARLSTKTEVLRALFARSGNQCSFPGCDQSIINHKNQFVGQVCHIESALPGGERYNKNSNDEYRRSYENLILLCYPHHVETNEENEFSVTVMQQMKSEHESSLSSEHYAVEEISLEKIERDLDVYWSNIELLNSIEHVIPELAMEVRVELDVIELIDGVRDTASKINDLLDLLASSDSSIENEFLEFLKRKNIDPELFEDIPYNENPFINRNWESHALASTNHMARLNLDLLTLEIKYLEQYTETNSDDKAFERLLKSRSRLASIADKIGHAD